MYIFPKYFFLIIKDLTVNFCNFDLTSSFYFILSSYVLYDV